MCCPLVLWISPRLQAPRVAYGTTGTGVEEIISTHVLKRDFDDATRIKVNGDFLYRLRVHRQWTSTELPPGTPVVFETLEGQRTLVQLIRQPMSPFG